MALSIYEQAQLEMLSEEQRLIVLTAEQILDGITGPEITLLQIKYSEEIQKYIHNKKIKLLLRGNTK
jgi:hypothetical protein